MYPEPFGNLVGGLFGAIMELLATCSQSARVAHGGVGKYSRLLCGATRFAMPADDPRGIGAVVLHPLDMLV
jgi:hypothetical protein